MTQKEQLSKLLSDEAYLRELAELRDPAKIRDNLAEHDVDMTEEEVRQVIGMLKRRASGELTDEELASVSGGEGIILVISILFAAAFGGSVYGASKFWSWVGDSC